MSSAGRAINDKCLETSKEVESEEDFIVLESLIEKVRMLLRGREGIEILNLKEKPNVECAKAIDSLGREH